MRVRDQAVWKRLVVRRMAGVVPAAGSDGASDVRPTQAKPADDTNKTFSHLTDPKGSFL